MPKGVVKKPAMAMKKPASMSSSSNKKPAVPKSDTTRAVAMDSDCFSEEPYVPTYNAEYDFPAAGDVIPDAFPGVMPDIPAWQHSPSPFAVAVAPTGWLDQWDLMTRDQQLFVRKNPEGIFACNLYEPQPGDVCGTGDMPIFIHIMFMVFCQSEMLYSYHVHVTNPLIQGDSQPSRP